jgi:endonuclease/exonuclease/phosphatase family metal-dependent hydrolase
MRRHFALRQLFAAATAVTLLGCAPTAARTTPASVAQAGSDAPSLRVMSFNLRYNNAGDGPNAWPLRKVWVAKLIRFHAPDVIGVQEALPGMLADLDTLLGEYARIGVGRADGRERGEFSAILYRRDRLELLDGRTFWLSTAPEVPGSKGWDTAIERIATWGRFRDHATGCTYVHLNTHFDHVGEQARQESARLIRQRLRTIAKGEPVIVTGDLNTDPQSVAYRILTRDTLVEALPPLRDAMLVSRAGHYGPTATWNAFKAIEPGRRIDFVLVSPQVEVRQHGILPDSWDGRFPSDHLPVLAALGRVCG